MVSVLSVADKLKVVTQTERCCLQKLFLLPEASVDKLDEALNEVHGGKQEERKKKEGKAAVSLLSVCQKLMNLAEDERSCLKKLLELEESTLKALLEALTEMDAGEGLDGAGAKVCSRNNSQNLANQQTECQTMHPVVFSATNTAIHPNAYRYGTDFQLLVDHGKVFRDGAFVTPYAGTYEFSLCIHGAYNGLFEIKKNEKPIRFISVKNNVSSFTEEMEENDVIRATLSSSTFVSIGEDYGSPIAVFYGRRLI